jgi:hypothetical protein
MGTDKGCGAASPAGARVARYYRFQDASGGTHIVDSIDSVPQASRANAQCIEYAAQPDAPTDLGSVLAHGPSGWQSFGLGVTATLLVVLVFRKLPGTMRLVLRVGVIGGVVALLAGAYLGWLRRTTQQSGDAFSGPGSIIDDAKQAVAKMNARTQAQQTELKEIEQGQGAK